MANSTAKKSTNNSKSNNARRILFFFLVVLMCLALVPMLTPTIKTEEVPLSDVIARANDENGDIAKITVSGSELKITLKGKDQPTQISRKDASGTLYDQGLVNHCDDKSGEELTKCQEKYPTIEYVEATNFWNNFWDIALVILPIVAIAIFFVFLMRQAQSMNNQSMGFGKAKAKLYGPDKKKVKFEDVAGNESAKQDLTEIVDFLKNPKKYWRKNSSRRPACWRSWYW